MSFVKLITYLVLSYSYLNICSPEPRAQASHVDVEMYFNLSHLISEESIMSMFLYIVLSRITKSLLSAALRCHGNWQACLQRGLCVCAL